MLVLHNIVVVAGVDHSGDDDGDDGDVDSSSLGD